MQSNWDTFTVGVEIVVTLAGYVEEFDASVSTPIKEAVNTVVGVTSGTEIEFTPSFLRTTHMWIRLKGLDATTNQEQQVAANLTEVLPDDDLEKAQAFLSNALARAASADDADAVTSVQVEAIPFPATVLCFPDTSGASEASGEEASEGQSAMFMAAAVIGGGRQRRGRAVAPASHHRHHRLVAA